MEAKLRAAGNLPEFTNTETSQQICAAVDMIGFSMLEKSMLQGNYKKTVMTINYEAHSNC